MVKYSKYEKNKHPITFFPYICFKVPRFSPGSGATTSGNTQGIIDSSTSSEVEQDVSKEKFLPDEGCGCNRKHSRG